MASPKPKEKGGSSSLIGFFVLAASLLVLLSLMFARSFEPGQVVHSNDGPLGAISAKAASLPGGFHGLWEDLNWIGGESVGARPSFTILMAWLLGPLGYAKFAPPIMLFVLGLSAWLFFRQLQLLPVACVLGGLAAALNSDCFSTACWGVVANPVCVAANFLALAAVANPAAPHPRIRMVLAGFAVGLGVMEGFDVGAIFSLFTAAYVLFQSWNTEDGPRTAARLGRGMLRVACVAMFAGMIAVSTVESLVSTQIQGVAGAAQDQPTKQARWDEKTMWSFPKSEVLQVMVPGMFGYRMDTPGGGEYWGAVGEQPGVQWRSSGSGFYAGISVIVAALWAVLQSFRSQGSPFTLAQRRSVWFWLVLAVIGTLLSFGRYAAFYQIFYALPYASTIRGPFKFLHIAEWSLVILCAHGIHAVFLACRQNTAGRVQGPIRQFKAWWAKASAFDRKCLTGCFCAVAASLLLYLVYAWANGNLREYLTTVGIGSAQAPAVARFSLQAVGWFVLFLFASVVLLSLILSGQFSGARAKWAGFLLGLVLVGDLARANLPWIIYWDVPYKYATNPIIDVLRDRPYEHRVVETPFQPASQQAGLFHALYGGEWTQHLYPYNNIQSVAVVQEPRETLDNNAFRAAISAQNPATIVRHWQLTNTRFLLGPEVSVDTLNRQFDPARQRFRTVQRFELAPKTGASLTNLVITDLTASLSPTGELALIEFTGALPRASLYSNWQVNTNREDTLHQLAGPSFDPLKSVLVDGPIPAPSPGNTNNPAGTVQITNYQPKHIELQADVKIPAVLLYNDKYSLKWHVTVDGKTEPLLRCNFIMRGVYLQPGRHDVVLQFSTSETTLYISSVAVLAGLVLCGWVAFSKSPPAPAPAAKAAKLSAKAGAKA